MQIVLTGGTGFIGGRVAAALRQRGSAAVLETVWRIRRRQDEPPVTRFAVAISGQHYRIDSARARSELGWRSRDDYARAIRESLDRAGAPGG